MGVVRGRATVVKVDLSPSPQAALAGPAPPSGSTAALPEVRVVAVGRLEGERVSRLSPAHQISGLEIPRGLREGAAVKRAHREGFLDGFVVWARSLNGGSFVRDVEAERGKKTNRFFQPARVSSAFCFPP